MIGKYIWDAYEYSDRDKSEHMQVFNTGIPIINKYKAHAFNNGKPIYKSYSTLPIFKDGELVGSIGVSGGGSGENDHNIAKKTVENLGFKILK